MEDTTSEVELPSVEDEPSESAPQFDPSMLFSMAAMQMPTRQLALALLTVLDGHAWRSMGLMPDYLSGETKEDLPSAQLAIDIVQFLLGKVESDLSETDRNEAQRRLKDLRMNYVNRLNKS